MDDTAQRILLFSMVTFVSAWIGGIVPLQLRWRAEQLWLLISFGAGVLLGAAFLHMLPEAGELAGAGISSLALVGLLVLYFVEKFVMVHACGAGEGDHHTTGLAAFVGLSLHSLFDGVAIASSATVPALGPVVVLAIITHQVPASLSLTGLLRNAEYRPRQIVALVGLFSVMVPVGAMGTYFIIGALSEYAVGALIAVSAGTFIYIAGSDLLPELHRAQPYAYRSWTLCTFIAGVALTWAAGFLEP